MSPVNPRGWPPRPYGGGGVGISGVLILLTGLIEWRCRRRVSAWPVREIPELAGCERRTHPAQFQGNPSTVCSLPGTPFGVEPVSSSVGKRERERQKLERAHAKEARKAARQGVDTADSDVAVSPSRSEAELIDDMRRLQQDAEDGAITPEDFEERRDRIRAQLERLSL